MTLRTRSVIRRLTHGNAGLGWLVLAATVFIAYSSALRLGFYGDDWIFYDLAGRLPLRDYLIRYFDPNAQTAWFRPIQGVLFLIEYHVFQADLLGYHLLNVLFHLGNCLLLFALLHRVTANKRISIVAALLFASLPTAALTVFWPGVIDTLETLFYLLAVWFWIGYLQGGRRRDYWLAIVAFLFALFTKEIGVTLPITLFLIDGFILRRRVALIDWARRYLWFLVVWMAYLPIEYIVTRRSVFVSQEGYTPSLRLFSNLLDYLSTLAFPWIFYPPFSYIWLALVTVILAFVILGKKHYALIPIIVGAVLAVLPIALFPIVSNRFLYLPLVASAIFGALFFDWIWQKRPQSWATRALLLAVVAVVVALSSMNIWGAAADFGEWGRVARVPFRNISQAHPTFPDDTLLYFIDPPVPGPNLSGMFMWRYGPRVVVRANDSDQPAGLRDHSVAYVYTFDEQGNQEEQRVKKDATVRVSPTLPVDFAAPIRLEGLELANPQVSRGQAILLVLYWRALKPMGTDYNVFVHLLEPNGNVVASYEKEPRAGKASTSAWVPGQRIVDAVVLPLPGDVASRDNYRLEVGMFEASNQQKLGIMEPDRQVISDRILIEPIGITQ